ncbi:hypothetical protein RJ55_01361 [Drechmeria coniospora]|nr:hypothetical protein RJ55_01361 [Drechmeria coniospora]
MEARLLDSLHQRLGELEHKIVSLRGDLAVDFQHYYDDLLRGVPSAVASNVHRNITASFARYPTLRPELDPQPQACAEIATSPAPQPSPPESSEADRSLDERDLDFHGLFTPNYLPLLDSSSTLANPTPAGASSSAAGMAPSALHPTTTAAQDMAVDGPIGGGRPDAPDQTLPLAQAPAGSAWQGGASRGRDDAGSSFSSDKSDSKPPRSALRRSSSTAKPPQSPRRVRFEFMGAEVLPTASPLPPKFISPRLPSPGADDDGGAFTSNLGAEIGEDEERSAPPRKVSSSDALRALSRAPLEEGSVWTVVNADSDDAAPSRSGGGTPTMPSPAPHRAGTPPFAHGDPSATLSRPEESRGAPRTKSSDDEDVDGSLDDDSSDDGFLAMRTARPSKLPIQSPTPQTKPAPAGVLDETSDFSMPQDDDDDDDQDEHGLFFFETGGRSAPSRPRRGPSPRRVDELDDSDMDEKKAGGAGANTSDIKLSVYASSPAVSIRPLPASQSLATPAVKFQPGSLGSYRGRPLMMPIVRDPELLKTANSVDQQEVSVDAVDATSVLEDGSPPRFPSTPMSFKERFMMEEMMERRTSTRESKTDAPVTGGP